MSEPYVWLDTCCPECEESTDGLPHNTLKLTFRDSGGTPLAHKVVAYHRACWDRYVTRLRNTFAAVCAWCGLGIPERECLMVKATAPDGTEAHYHGDCWRFHQHGREVAARANVDGTNDAEGQER
jgi:hypothetical protein